MKKMTSLLTKKILLLFLVYLSYSLFSAMAIAQNYEGLKELKGYKIKIFCSTDAEERATLIAKNVDGAQTFLSSLVGFEPEVTVVILNPADWPKFTKGAFYGMPHYVNQQKVLNIASEDNAFWKSFIPQVDKLPKDLAAKITTAYVGKDGKISMQPFFDLLAIHELAHAYHNQGGLKMQRRWMGELFANISLHTYIAERNPKLLPALTAFPQMVIADGKANFKYTSLKDLEDNYNELGSKMPQNYGWYQCRLHDAAAKIYDGGGIKLYKKLWTTLKTQQELLNDEQLVDLLAKNTDQSMADILINWDK